jgi:predicted regulator of Ras-like GTPase activity (Roadblock/LC7/MglB family)
MMSSVDAVLRDLLRYEEILGAVAINTEGLVMGRAGIEASDADVAGAMGAALVGATVRTARRLGAGLARVLSVSTPDGLIHVHNAGPFAVIVFSEPCDITALERICDDAVNQIGSLLQPAA